MAGRRGRGGRRRTGWRPQCPNQNEYPTKGGLGTKQEVGGRRKEEREQEKQVGDHSALSRASAQPEEAWEKHDVGPLDKEGTIRVGLLEGPWDCFRWHPPLLCTGAAGPRRGGRRRTPPRARSLDDVFFGLFFFLFVDLREPPRAPGDPREPPTRPSTRVRRRRDEEDSIGGPCKSRQLP